MSTSTTAVNALDALITERFGGGDDFEILRADGFDECVVGIAYRFGQTPILAYDRDKMLEKLVGEGLDYAEAEEYFEFNIIGAWMGEGTPCFVEMLTGETHG